MTADEPVIVLCGDDGGQVYVVVPARLVQCSEDALYDLLEILDYIQWPGNEGASASIRRERHPMGAHVDGGMGGGTVIDGVWVHARLRDLGLKGEICEVLAGTRAHIESVFDQVHVVVDMLESSPEWGPRVVLIAWTFEEAHTEMARLEATEEQKRGRYRWTSAPLKRRVLPLPMFPLTTDARDARVKAREHRHNQLAEYAMDHGRKIKAGLLACVGCGRTIAAREGHVSRGDLVACVACSSADPLILEKYVRGYPTHRL